MHTSHTTVIYTKDVFAHVVLWLSWSVMTGMRIGWLLICKTFMILYVKKGSFGQGSYNQKMIIWIRYSYKSWNQLKYYKDITPCDPVLYSCLPTTKNPQSQTSWGWLYGSFCTILHDHWIQNCSPA